MMPDEQETDGPFQEGPFMKPRDLRRKVLQLAKEGTKNFYDLARFLAPLHDLRPALLKKVEEHSNLRRRTLYYLVDVGRMLRNYHIDKAQAERIGWTKLQILARHLDKIGDVSPTELASLLEMAAKKEVKVYELPSVLAGRTGKTRRRTVLLRLSPSEYDDFAEALVRYGAIRKGRGLLNQKKALMKLIRAALEQTT